MVRALLLLLVLNGVPQEKPNEKPRDVGAGLKPIREKHDVPALAALLVRADGTIVMQGVDGVRKRGEAEHVTIDDLFHLGSCTKSMTATMIESLIDEGKLTWETTVAGTFKDVEMDPGWEKATLEHLLTNRAGAPENLDKDGLWGRLWTMTADDPVKQRRAMLEGVLKNPPTQAPGTKYAYSNAGFSIAGAMAEKVMGIAWEDLMRRRLFDPLGMKSASFGAPGAPGKLDQPWGHRADGNPVEPGPGADNPASIAPAGLVHASLPDWAKYAAFHLRLKPASKLHEAPKGANPAYAKGWILTERKWAGGLTLTHNGSNTMWFAVIWMAPKKEFAVLAVTNQGGDKAAAATDAAATALILDYVKK